MDYDDFTTVPEGPVVVLKQEVVEEVAMKQEEEGKMAMDCVADPTFDCDQLAGRDDSFAHEVTHQYTPGDCDNDVVEHEGG